MSPSTSYVAKGNIMREKKDYLVASSLVGSRETKERDKCLETSLSNEVKE